MARILRGIAGGGRFPPAYWTNVPREISYPGFGKGLNLRDQPDAVAPDAAIDCLDVTFTQLGAVKQRDGYGRFSAAEGTNRFDSLCPFYRTGSAAQLVVGDGPRLDALSTTGAVVTSSSFPTASPHFFARFGGPTAERVFAANGTDQVRWYDGTTINLPTYTGTAPTGMFLAVTPWDNRLVNARRSGSTAGDNVSSVRFSDPGVPTTWGANNYIDLTPGDGEAITGMVAWENMLFVFKDSRFFVFYGTGTDSTGNPVFNYQTVSTGCGAASGRAVVAARDGVYFMDRKGVYKTTGGAPQLVSGVLDPFFVGGASSFFQSSVLNHGSIGNAAMAWHDEKVWLAVPTGGSSNDRLLVFDPRYNWWSLYSIPAAALASFRVGDQAELVFAYASGLKHIGRHSAAYGNDDGALIGSRWQSGWFDYGMPDIKTLREFKVWGSGKVNVALIHDYAPSAVAGLADFTASVTDKFAAGATPTDLFADGTNTADVFTTAKGQYPILLRNSVRGTTFSLQLSSYQGNPWTFGRMTSHIRDSDVAAALTRE